MPGFVPPGFEGRVRPPEPERHEGSFDMQKAYQVAQGILEKEAIDPRKFGEPYNQKDVLADMQNARDLEAMHEREDDEQSRRARKLAKVLEVVIYQQVNGGWFGPDAHAMLPSKYDDFRNQVDLITEFDFKETGLTTHAAMGIDVTYSHELKKKIHGIKEKIDAGELGTVKYFKSKDGRFVGSLRKVPHVVVGMEDKSAMVMARAWYENNPALKKDPLRDQLLIQIIDQCEAFERYADARGNKEAAEAYRRTKEIFQKNFGRSVTPESRSRFAKDKVFQTLELLIHEL